jgi:hypothetical protein
MRFAVPVRETLFTTSKEKGQAWVERLNSAKNQWAMTLLLGSGNVFQRVLMAGEVRPL